MPVPRRESLDQRIERWRQEASQSESAPRLSGLRNGPHPVTEQTARVGYWLDAEQLVIVTGALREYVTAHLEHASHALDHHALWEVANAFAAFDLLYRLREARKADLSPERLAQYVNPEQLEMSAARVVAGAPADANVAGRELNDVYIVARFYGHAGTADAELCMHAGAADAAYRRQTARIPEVTDGTSTAAIQRVVQWRINDGRIVLIRETTRDAFLQYQSETIPGEPARSGIESYIRALSDDDVSEDEAP